MSTIEDTFSVRPAASSYYLVYVHPKSCSLHPVTYLVPDTDRDLATVPRTFPKPKAKHTGAGPTEKCSADRQPLCSEGEGKLGVGEKKKIDFQLTRYPRKPKLKFAFHPAGPA